MTYNFDPDQWYENELYVIEHKYRSNLIAKQEYDKAIQDLEDKHTKMWERLDGSYQFPK